MDLFSGTSAGTYTLISESGHTVRVTAIDNEPWFVAMDVCSCLGFHRKSDGTVNTTYALRHCNEDEIITRRLSDKRGRGAKLISESGLYKLVMRSDKPQAEEFQNWVTKVVLLAIRKDGGGEASRRCPAPTGPLGVELITMPGVELHASH
jgi:prophage antirepressor-like protein